MENIVSIVGIIVIGLLGIGYLVFIGLVIKWIIQLGMDVLKNW
jgi:hypothetical protein